jgi:hypothetical protein
MKNAMMKAVTVLVLIANIPLGHTDDSTIFLKKGDPAKFDGYEITPQKTIDIRNLGIDMDTTKKINANLAEENNLLTQRLQNAQQQDNFLADQLNKERDTSFLSKAAFFVFGALTVGLVSYGVYRTR